MAGRVANGSVSRFPPAQSRNRRRSREDRGAKTSGDESDHNSRARRNRRREERMRAVMTDTEAVIKNHQNQPHHRYAIFLGQKIFLRQVRGNLRYFTTPTSQMIRAHFI